MSKDEHSAFVASLFRRYGKDVRAFLGQRLDSTTDVEDLTQETFLRAQRTRDWNAVSNHRAYLIKTARNLFLDLLRGERRSIVDYGYEALADYAGSERSPEQLAISQDEYQHLCYAINRLSPKVRKAMILHKFFNLSFTEVARAMDISPRTVEKHIARGVAECLRHMMIVERRADGRGAQTSNVVSLGARGRPANRKEPE